MQLRTFRVPFARVVGEEATELEFGPDDYLVVRPLFGLSKTALSEWAARFNVVTAAEGSDAADLSDKLVLDLLGACVIEWHLDGPDGPIAKPGTVKALNALPGALAGSLFTFLSGYRGEAPGNPTTSN